MKQLKCETCGGTDFIKQDGVFVCQGCSMKYSVEEAQKLTGENDNNNKLANLYTRARQSLEVNDLTHAAEYFKQILDENPHDWEAYFYSYLGEHTTFTNAEAASVASKLGDTIPAAYDMAVENAEESEIAARINTITTQTINRLSGIAASGASLLRQYEGGNLSPSGNVNANLYSRMRPMVQATIISCVVAFDPLDAKIQELADKSVISEEVKIKSLQEIRRAKYNTANMSFRPNSFSTEKLLKVEVIGGFAEKLKEVDPSFEIPPQPQQQTTSSSGCGGCYVATAVYGSYDCPEVWTLRRYRDNTLAETWYGRAFIKTYYAISPTLVKWFGDTAWFKNMWKGRLDRMVANLQADGVESTPYEDRNW